MSPRLMVVLGVVAVVGFILVMSATFVVDQREQALVIQFGEPRRVIKEPGLNFKTPFVQDVVFFDKRLLEFDAPAAEVIAADQKRLVVDAYARYRITDPLRFFQSIHNELGLRSQLGAVISSNLRRVLGTVALRRVVSDERAGLMRQIRDSVRKEAANYGITVDDVRIKRADLPPENSEAIYRRMQTERQQEAAQLRAKGAEEAQKILATADREKIVVLADAERDGQIMRGEGEAEMNRIFAAAFGRDPDFFAFYRSMQAYRNALGSDDTTMVLSPDSEFFRYFSGASGPSSDDAER